MITFQRRALERVCICEHSSNGAIVLIDILGRYSIEWPCYWDAKTEKEKVCDYSMSYLCLGTEQNVKVKVEHFPVRYWTGAEVENLVEELSLK